MKPLFAQSLRDFKSKFHSTFGTFCIVALLSFAVAVPVMLATGTAFYYSMPPELPSDMLKVFETVNYNFSSMSNAVILPNIAFAALFFAIYGMRNNYATYLSFSSTRRSYMLSDLWTGIAYSGLFATTGFVTDCFSRVLSGSTAGNYVFSAEIKMSLGHAAGNMIATFGICIAIFVGVMAIINCISRKKYLLILLYLAIPVIYAILIFFPEIFLNDRLWANGGEPSRAFMLYDKFRASSYGIMLIGLVHAATMFACNLLIINKEGGFRR